MSTASGTLDKDTPYVLALALGGLLLFVLAMARTFGFTNLLRGPGSAQAKEARKLTVAGPYSLEEVYSRQPALPRHH